MVLHVLLIALGFISTQSLDAHEKSLEPSRRVTLDKTLNNVNALFEAMLQELNESHTMYHTSCKKALEREAALKERLVAIQKENEHMITIKAELALAQKDLQQALNSEAKLKEKLTMLQHQAESKISSIRDEFEAVRSKFEATSNNFGKVFW